MAGEQKPSARRGDMAFILAIILGLVLGVLIKRVRLGIILGLILGSAIVFLGWIRVNKK
jgi:hypothetical protein